MYAEPIDFASHFRQCFNEIFICNEKQFLVNQNNQRVLSETEITVHVVQK